jgi:hypothetical protein
MSNPWGVKLKKTGLTEQRVAADISSINELENNQSNLQMLASANSTKKQGYEDRQASLAADAMSGQQGMLPGQKGAKKRRRSNKRRRNSNKRRTSKKENILEEKIKSNFKNYNFKIYRFYM